MASYNELIALINAFIKQNGIQAITGQILNGVLRAMVDQIGRGYAIMGTAVPTDDPGTPDAPESWFASTPGTYTNFGGFEVADAEFALLSYTPSTGWAKNTLTTGITEVDATVDNTTGTPSVSASYANGVLSFEFHNLKGATGDPAGFGTVNATVDANIGTPSVSVSGSGPDTAKNYTFAFHNLKGETGVTSVVATVDNTTGNPACAVSLVGQELHLDFTGLKGAQGNTGSSVDYPFTIVNNLTTNDATQALSAAMGVELASQVSQLEAKVTDFEGRATAADDYNANFIFDNFIENQQQEYDEGVREIEEGVAMWAAQQDAVIAMKDTGTVIAEGRCGDTLYWQVNSNRSLRIFGTGRMYDYLKGTNVGLNKGQITNTIYLTPFMFYYSWNIPALRTAIETLKSEGYTESSYKGVADSSTTPASGKCFYIVKPVDADESFSNFPTAASTPAEITAGNHLTILKRNTGETYWTKEDVSLELADGVVYDERTVHFTGDGTKTVFNYVERLNVLNSVSVGGSVLSSGYSYDSVTGNLTFDSAPANGADIECEFAQYVNPWYIFRIEKSFHRYVWVNGATEVYTTDRNPDITTDRAYFDKTFAGDGYEITAKASGFTPATIEVGGVTYTYSEFVEGYCPRKHYLSFNPNEYTYNTITVERGITYLGDWGFYRNSGMALILPEGITATGIWCIRFSDYTKAVRFPSTLEKIGWYGCSRMTALEYIQILGSSLVYCDDECFHNCIALKGLVLPMSVTHLGEMFAYANQKMKIVDLGSADTIDNQGLQNVYDLKVLRCGAVEQIGEAAVQNAKVKVLFIPSSLESVGNQAFTGCSDLKTLVVDSEMVDSMNYLTDFGYLFNYATIVYLKKTLQGNLLRGCFANTGTCKGYDRLVKWGEEHTPGSIASGLMERALGNGPDGVHWILYKTQNVGKYKLVISGYNGVGTYKGNPWENVVAKSDIEEIEVRDTTLGSSAFYVASGYSNVKKIVVVGGTIQDNFHLGAVGTPDTTMTELHIEGVTAIGNSAFAFNNGLTNIVIPDSVITIGTGVFSGAVASLVLGKNVRDIGDNAFHEVNRLSLDADNSIETLGNGAFFYWGGDGMTKLYLPNVKTMGTSFPRFYGAAKGCTDIYIGDKITSIGANCFSGLSGTVNRVCNIHIAARQADVTVGSGAFGAGATVTWEDPWMEE